MNAAYLRLLQGFHLLLQDTAWEKELYARLDRIDLEQVPKRASDFTKTEVMYLRFLSRYFDDPKKIDDAFLEGIQPFLPVRFLKQELLVYLAELWIVDTALFLILLAYAIISVSPLLVKYAIIALFAMVPVIR